MAGLSGLSEDGSVCYVPACGADERDGVDRADEQQERSADAGPGGARDVSVRVKVPVLG